MALSCSLRNTRRDVHPRSFSRPDSSPTHRRNLETALAKQSPIPFATAKLAAQLETKLTQEVGGPVGNVLPLPHKGSVMQLQQDIDKLAGRTVLVESTSVDWGGGKDSAPRGDWQTRRIGANPPESMIGLRKDVQASILAACGCPGSLIERG